RNDVPFVRYAATDNQRAVARALDSGSYYPPTGMAELYDEVLNAEPGEVAAMMEPLSGQVHAGTQSALFNAGSKMTDTIASRVRANAAGARSASAGKTAQAAGAGGPVAARSAGSTSSRAGLPLWAQVIGGRGTLDGNGNAKGVRDDTTGLFLGGDATIG